MKKFIQDFGILLISILIVTAGIARADYSTVDFTQPVTAPITMAAGTSISFTGGGSMGASTFNGVSLSYGGQAFPLSTNAYTAVADQNLASTADTSVFNTSVNGYIGTTTVPANYLTVGKSFVVSGFGVYTTPSLNTATALLKIQMASSSSATLIASDTSAALIASAANWNYNWTYTCTVRTTGTSGTIQCDGLFGFATSASGTVYAYVNLTGIGKIDTTKALTINATNAWSSVAGGQSATEKETFINFNN